MEREDAIEEATCSNEEYQRIQTDKNIYGFQSGDL